MAKGAARTFTFAVQCGFRFFLFYMKKFSASRYFFVSLPNLMMYALSASSGKRLEICTLLELVPRCNTLGICVL